MARTFDKEPLEFECPECNAKVRTTIGDARRSKTLTCPNGHTIRTDGSQLDRETRKVERAIDDVIGKFGRLSR